ncbi:983_t:CDS:2, partial [Dentiscutata heterogama]
YSSSESTQNHNSRNGLNKKPDLKGYLGLENHNIEVFFVEVSSGPFESTIASIKHEEDDYKKLILFSKDAYNYIRENYSSDDSNWVSKIQTKIHKIIEEICINYTSDKEHNQSMEGILSDQELTNEELEDSFSEEDTSEDLTDSSEELSKCKNGSLIHNK